MELAETPVRLHTGGRARLSGGMLEVLRDNALDTMGSLDLTGEQAIRILSPDFDLAELQAPDPTWQKHWLAGASKVASDDQERQEWWARLLAGELKGPGSYSLRSIAAMDVLSREEAELFTRFAPYFWDVTNGSHPGFASSRRKFAVDAALGSNGDVAGSRTRNGNGGPEPYYGQPGAMLGDKTKRKGASFIGQQGGEHP